MDINSYIVGLVLLASHVVTGDYLGGSMRYTTHETNGTTMVDVTVLSGWTLGTGPCGHLCKIGQTTSGLMHQISTGLSDAFFGRWVTREKGSGISHDRDVTHVVNSVIHQYVIDINRRDNWELELGRFTLPLRNRSMDIIYFRNNMTRLTVQQGLTQSYMEMKINMLGNRSDTRIPNNSPITDSRPFVRLALGRHYRLRIATVDPDQDYVTCRPPRFVEFLELYLSAAPNVTINKNCTIDVYTDPARYKTGDAALVGIVVEDFPRKQIHITNTSFYVNAYSPQQSLSQSPVQFYIEITGGDDSPVFIHPPTPPHGQVFTLYQGAKLTIEVFARPSASNRTITNFRYVSADMARYLTRSHLLDRHDIGPMVRSQQITWIPRADMTGFYSLCVIAEDSEGFDSVSNYCFAIEVKEYPTTTEELTARPGVPHFVNFPQPDELNFPTNSLSLFPIYAGSAVTGGGMLRVQLTNTTSHGMTITSIDNGSDVSKVTVQTNSSLGGRQDVCFQIWDELSLLERCTNVYFHTADPCERMPCKNSGICVRIDTADKVRCQCAGGYQGAACEIAPNPCAPQPCKNGGKCVLLFGTNYRCVCPLGKTGSNCDNEINHCQWDSCAYGVCEDRPGNFTCHCAESFTGNECTGSDNSTALCPGILQNITGCTKQCQWCSEPHGICRPANGANLYDECTCSVGYENPGKHCQSVNGDVTTAAEYGPKFVPPTPGPLSTINCELDLYSSEKCSFPVYAASLSTSRTAPVVESLFSRNEVQVTVSPPSATGIKGVFMYVTNIQQCKENRNSKNKYTVCLKISTSGNVTDRVCVTVNFTTKGMSVHFYQQYRKFVGPTLPHDSEFTCRVGKACHIYLYTEKDSDHCERIISEKDASIEIFSPKLLNGSCVSDVAFKPVSVHYRRLCFRAGLGGESRCFGVILDSSKDTCTESSCGNGGVCVPQADSHYCICPPNYSGTTCQSYEGPCLSDLCHERGLCYVNGNNTHCLCQIGYSGATCQTREIAAIHEYMTDVAIFYHGAFPTHVTCFLNSPCFMNVFIISRGSANFSPGYTDIVYDKMSAYRQTETVLSEADIGVLMIIPTKEGQGRACIQLQDDMSGSTDETCFTIDTQSGYTAPVNKIFPYFMAPTAQNNTIYECTLGSECHIMIWTHKADGDLKCPKVEMKNTAFDTIGIIVIQNLTSACVMDVTFRTQGLNETTDLCLTLRPNRVETEIYESGMDDRRCYSVLVSVNTTVTSPCANIHCYNGGYCDSRQGIPYCLCRLGFSGQHCELLHPGIHSNPAANRRLSFADDAFPSNIVCQLDVKCSFIVNLWGPDNQIPTVWFDHVDNSIIAEQPIRSPTTNTSPGIYSMLITVNGTQVGTFETILQTSYDTGLVADELWFRYEIKAGPVVTTNENQPHFINPSFPAESTIKCSNEQLCHIILMTEAAAFDQCPHVEFVSEPRDSVHIFQDGNSTALEHDGCMADVSLLASNKQLATERYCFRLSLPTVPGETRCYRVQYGSARL